MDGGSAVIYNICKIDLALYSVVASNIVTDEVIITSERITFLHIRDSEWRRLLRSKKVLYKRE